MFPAFCHFFYCLNEHHVKCRASKSYCTDMRRGQRFPDRYINGKTASAHIRCPHKFVVTAGKQPSNTGKKVIAVWEYVTGKQSLHPNSTVVVTVLCFKALFCLFKTQIYGNLIFWIVSVAECQILRPAVFFCLCFIDSHRQSSPVMFSNTSYQIQIKLQIALTLLESGILLKFKPSLKNPLNNIWKIP